MSNKTYGLFGESIALERYQDQGRYFIERNYGLKRGEIDLIFRRGDFLLFVEVKIVDHIDSLFGYITQKKQRTLRKLAEYYARKKQIGKQKIIEVVYIKNNTVYSVNQL